MPGTNFKEISPQELAGYIDHTLLKPEAGPEAVEQLCAEVIKYGFAMACVNPCYVRWAAELLADHLRGVCGVVGFPLGANQSRIKQAEAERNIQDGASEIDMVINIGAAAAGDFDYVRQDIEAVLRPCREAKPTVGLKVILEMGVLGRQTKIRLCKLAGDLGVDFIKTSTGMHETGGATVEDVELMYEHRGGCKVKASGGIRDMRTALAMLAAGAERIGTSWGRMIMEEMGVK